MMIKNNIDAELIKKHFSYEDGFLYWKLPRANRVKVGQIAGGKHHTGYWVVNFYNKSFMLHRLVWAFHNDKFPDEKFDIDHIDCNRLNNKIENLREASRSENCLNRHIHSGKSKHIGVHYDASRRGKKWVAQIKIDRKVIFRSLFKTEEEAALARNEKLKSLVTIFKENNV